MSLSSVYGEFSGASKGETGGVGKSVSGTSWVFKVISSGRGRRGDGDAGVAGVRFRAGEAREMRGEGEGRGEGGPRRETGEPAAERE